MTINLHDVEEIANVCVCDAPQNAELGKASCCDGIQLLPPAAKRKLKERINYQHKVSMQVSPLIRSQNNSLTKFLSASRPVLSIVKSRHIV